MVDWTRVQELQDDLGEDDFEEITALFMEEVEERLATLVEGRSEDIADDLHFLKGSAANLGFATMRDTCAALEESHDESAVGQLANTYAVSKKTFLDGLQQKSGR